MPQSVRQSVIPSLSLAMRVGGSSLKTRGASSETRGVSLLALDQPEYPFLPLAVGQTGRAALNRPARHPTAGLAPHRAQAGAEGLVRASRKPALACRKGPVPVNRQVAGRGRARPLFGGADPGSFRPSKGSTGFQRETSLCLASGQ
ncbi:MAG TPA: hypothetical protein VFV57_03365 [Limnobacter sp.]|nr:hypothetical protein [Limnobacter sp.]